MKEDLVEKIARASFKCWRDRATANGRFADRLPSFEDMAKSGELPFALEHARAVLAAIEADGKVIVPKLPNKTMLRAAAKAMSPGKRPTPNRVSVARKHAIRYLAMVDAASPKASPR